MQASHLAGTLQCVPNTRGAFHPLVVGAEPSAWSYRGDSYCCDSSCAACLSWSGLFQPLASAFADGWVLGTSPRMTPKGSDRVRSLWRALVRVVAAGEVVDVVGRLG